MKKLFLLLAVLLLTAAAGWAQTQVATLNHQGNIRVFYGPDAFVNAVNAAVDDDVINLSAGYFNPTTIDKRLNIKGAGMLVDNNEDRSNTIIGSGGYNFPIQFTKAASGSSIEGIRFGSFLHNASGTAENFPTRCTFNKCCFSIYVRSGNNAFDESVFTECVIDIGTVGVRNSTFLNCCVCTVAARQGYFQNCYIYYKQTDATDSKLSITSSYTNCIMYGHCVNYNTSNQVAYNARNNLFLLSGNASVSPFVYTYNAVNYVATSDVFNSITNDFNHWFVGDFDFSLTDEAASQYVGTDGTQVGIYGGNMPFTPVVSNPRIVKCEVDSETSPEGKLNVNIEVKEGR